MIDKPEELKLCSIADCGYPVDSNGMCKMHDTRVRRTGSPHLRTTKDRLMDGIARDDNTGCWNWKRVSTDFGHGRIRVNGKKQIASRVSWMLHKGEIPEGMQVCHACDNPKCINPDHLFLGTQLDNVRDCIAKGRFNAGHVKGWNTRAKGDE